MALFRPNLKGQAQKRLGLNGFGEAMLGPLQDIALAIVEFKVTATKTSVRADSSASRGSVLETESAATLLLPAGVAYTPVMGDKLVVNGFELRIRGVAPMFNLTGALDHYQVTCGAWGGE